MSAEKTESRYFYPLAVSLATASLLRGQAVYHARIGIFSAPVAIVVLAAVIRLFCLCWRLYHRPGVRVLFTVYLGLSCLRAVAGIVEILQTLYPGLYTATALCVMLLLPVLYLRRSGVLCQTGQVLFWCFVIAGAVLLVGIAPRLRVSNLQVGQFSLKNVSSALNFQLLLLPEYLLPALFVPSSNYKSYSWPLPTAAVALDALLHFILELFFGEALLERSLPLHTAASSGALSLFNRLEWVGLVLCCAALSLKIGLYLYGILLLWQPDALQREQSSLPFYLWGTAAILIVFLFTRHQIDWMTALCGAVGGGLLSIVGIGGAMVWLGQRLRRSV